MPVVHPDLVKERRKATFDLDDITFQLSSKEEVPRRRLMYERFNDDPELKEVSKLLTMPRDELFDETVKRTTSVLQKLSHVTDMDEKLQHLNAAQPYPHSFGLQFDMFMPMLKSQGSDELLAKFLPMAERFEIIGTYAQTELGHGTYIRGLETTATFDKERQHFLLNSPTLTSMKFWPGGLGTVCNYAVVMAQLIIDGKQLGLHPFLCQLRDLQTHQPLPGLELGDIGNKFGSNMIDNGYMRLNQVRIPRTNMLMRYTKVSAEGEYTRQAIPQTTYLTMTYVRMSLVSGVSSCLARVATIATRYSAVRRQTANSAGIEPQILDYQTQQMKLFPAIATAYALQFAAVAVRDIYIDIMRDVESGNVARLPELHVMTCALKAFGSDIACDRIEVCRRACGGHGYSHASGIPVLYTIATTVCTVEGVNTVLYLQCARTLVKYFGIAKDGGEVPQLLQFLAETPKASAQLTAAKSLDIELCLEASRLNVLCSLLRQVLALETNSKSMDLDTAWNRQSAGLEDTAKMFALYLSMSLFVDVLLKRTWEPRAKAVMNQLCEFYIVNGILDFSGSFLRNKVLTALQVAYLTSRRLVLLSELRPNAVSLVDAFDYPDHMLNSCLGRYDGNVYEALYEYAKSSSLNKQQVHPSFHRYVKPMQKALKAKL